MNSLWSVLLFAFFPNTVQNPFSALRCCQTSRPRKEWLAEKPQNLMQENLKKQASHADACLCSNSSLEISNDNETLELCSLYSTLLFWKFQHTGAFTTHCMICFSCLLHYLFIWPSEHLQTTLSILCKNNSSKNHSWANIFESGLPSTNMFY